MIDNMRYYTLFCRIRDLGFSSSEVRRILDARDICRDMDYSIKWLPDPIDPDCYGCQILDKHSNILANLWGIAIDLYDPLRLFSVDPYRLRVETELIEEAISC